MDDLKLISGIGAATERKLHANGVPTFQALADLAGDDRVKVEAALDIKGAVDWDAWQSQARDLAVPDAPPQKAATGGVVEGLLVSCRTARRRAGRAFGPEELFIPIDELSEAEVNAIWGDKQLSVSEGVRKTDKAPG